MVALLFQEKSHQTAGVSGMLETVRPDNTNGCSIPYNDSKLQPDSISGKQVAADSYVEPSATL